MSEFIKKLKKAKDPRKVVCFLLRNVCPGLWPDKTYLQVYFFFALHKKLDLNNPITYNEKLQWLKLNDKHTEYTQLVDKYEVKQYLQNLGGGELLIPTIAVYNNVDEIDFKELPNRFVLKCTHDSGGIVICKDKSKLNIDKARKKLSKGLRTSYFNRFREYPYKNVKPRIIAEEYVEDSQGELIDYKFFCFNGEVKCLFVATDRNKGHDDVKFDFFDTEWNHLPFLNGHPNNEVWPKKPHNFDDMVEIAARLSKGFPHVRVDLYNCDGNIYFGEFTFFHWSGFTPFVPVEWDYKMGEMIKLPSA